MPIFTTTCGKNWSYISILEKSTILCDFVMGYSQELRPALLTLPVTNFTNVFRYISTVITSTSTEAYRITQFSLAFPLFPSTLSALSTIRSSVMECHSFRIKAYSVATLANVKRRVLRRRYFISKYFLSR